jgi:hypothetical protein
MSNRKHRGGGSNLELAIYAIVIVGMAVLAIWLAFFAPCEAVTWMPVKDVPTRCLEVNVR